MSIIDLLEARFSIFSLWVEFLSLMFRMAKLTAAMVFVAGGLSQDRCRLEAGERPHRVPENKTRSGKSKTARAGV
jgi:hypothetical protein